jgi:hypothetical protein
MPRIALFAVAAVGLSATACSYDSTTTIPASPGPVLATSPSSEACLDYGFVPGTIAYSRCVERTHEARMSGRVARGYAEARLATDARDACISYGLDPATGYFNRCMAREMDARRFRADQAYVPASTVYPQPQFVPPAPPPPPAGVQAFRDEYGFRYDGQGNRIDAHGNIISPHSTRP